MSKELIAVDMDEVLFPFIDEFIKAHNDLYETSLNRDQFPTYEFSEQLGLSIPETVERVYEFQRTLNGTNVNPLDQSKEAIEKIASKFSLEIVTARHSQFEEMTSTWINEHYPGYFEGITYIGFARVMENPRTKAEVCKEIGAVALIDDSLDHLEQCTGTGVDGILFGDYPWNQTDCLPEGTVRCNNWPEVLEHLNIG